MKPWPLNHNRTVGALYTTKQSITAFPPIDFASEEHSGLTHVPIPSMIALAKQVFKSDIIIPVKYLFCLFVCFLLEQVYCQNFTDTYIQNT